jgi:hypothetical protein
MHASKFNEAHPFSVFQINLVIVVVVLVSALPSTNAIEANANDTETIKQLQNSYSAYFRCSETKQNKSIER